jgi:hypothetical protein
MLAALTFASPWALVALAGLPVLWFLLRITPPSPRTEVFPAIRLLLGLQAREATPARTPWWLLLLRMFAAALVIVGLARPVLDAGGALPGRGPVLLVLDDGWAAAPGWTLRMAAAASVLDRAERAGRPVALLTTAPDETAAAPLASPPMPASEMRVRLGAVRPKPWGVDRAAAGVALAAFAAKGPAAAIYIADGLTDGAAWDVFARGFAGFEAVRVVGETLPARLLLPPTAEAEGLVAHIASVPQPLETTVAVLAQAGDGRTLARVDARFAPEATRAAALIALPPELRNRLTRLVLEGPAGAGNVVLLDERWRRRPVGLLAADAASGTPLSGGLYYLRRALEPYAELREGSLDSLLSRELSVLILADRVIADGPERAAIATFVDKGGLLLRFAGPQTAEHPDDFVPVKLLATDRQLGGAMSWSQPGQLAAFAAGTPFAGLAVPPEVHVQRQVLAEPGPKLPAATWASLTDGTPLVTQAARGAGRVVLFHVTANADWSDLPLSGLFVEMLRRTVDLSVGVAAGEDEAGRRLAPAETLDGFGQPTRPPAAAQAVEAGQIGMTEAGPRHPPGLYGPESGRRALNLATKMPPPQPAPAIAGAESEPLAGLAPERVLAPWFLAAALALLALDLILSIGLRGLWRGAAAACLLLTLAMPAHAQSVSPQDAALASRLAYVVTDDAQIDGISRAGLAGLSDYVNRRTAATLADPVGVRPGTDDLSVYPLLYWPIAPDATPPDGAAVAALNDFMAHGGIILIDTRNGGSGEGFAAGADAALARTAQGLAVPVLTPLTPGHVLARAFYLLQEFPGRYAGDTVWVQRDQDRTNDSVSPVIIGGHDWAAAWAVDAQGRNPYATIPGGARQRTLAYRFGVNVVMYALTGNYKGDQVHVPAILERLGQ